MKPVLSWSLAAVLGALTGGAIYVAYDLPGVLPTSDVFVYVVTTDWGRAAMQASAGEAGMMIAIAMRALPYSVLVGLIAGILVRRLGFPRVFCYAALALPCLRAYNTYVEIAAAAVTYPHLLPALKALRWKIFWTDLCVYGWYFVALYLAFFIAARIRQRGVAALPVPI